MQSPRPSSSMHARIARAPHGADRETCLQVVGKAVVRTKLSIKSPVCRELQAGATIVVLEEARCEGHHRARIGINEWVSLKTAKGSVLAVVSAAVAAVPVAAQVIATVVGVEPAAPSQQTVPASTASTSQTDYPIASNTSTGVLGSAVAVQAFAQAVDVESACQPATSNMMGTVAAPQQLPCSSHHLGLPPTTTAPFPTGGSAARLGDAEATTGTLYTTVAQAAVRTGPSLSNSVVRKLGPKCQVMVFEECFCDGHSRGRIGPDQWISIRTAKGKVLAIRGSLEAAQAATGCGQSGAIATTLAEPVSAQAVVVAAVPAAGTVQVGVLTAVPTTTAVVGSVAQPSTTTQAEAVDV